MRRLLHFILIFTFILPPFAHGVSPDLSVDFQFDLIPKVANPPPPPPASPGGGGGGAGAGYGGGGGGTSTFLTWGFGADIQGMKILAAEDAAEKAHKKYVNDTSKIVSGHAQKFLKVAFQWTPTFELPPFLSPDDVQDQIRIAGVDSGAENKERTKVNNIYLQIWLQEEQAAFRRHLDRTAGELTSFGRALQTRADDLAGMKLEFNVPSSSSASSGQASLARIERSFDTLEVRRKIERIDTSNPRAALLKETAGVAVDQSEFEWANGNRDEAFEFRELGTRIADMALGFDPITGFVRSLTEAVTGKNLVTGETLSNFEYALAIGGVFTLGGTNLAKNGLKLLSRSKVASHLINEGVTLGQKLAHHSREVAEKLIRAFPYVHELKLRKYIDRSIDYIQDYVVERVLTRLEANVRYIDKIGTKFGKVAKPPYGGELVFDLRLKKPQKFYQFISKDNIGELPKEWLIDGATYEKIKLLPDTDIKKLLSLPRHAEVYTHVRIVELQAESLVRAGEVSSIYDGMDGMRQFEALVDQRSIKILEEFPRMLK